MHAATASIPAPPCEGSTVTPSSPSSPAREKSSRLNASRRLKSSACGSTSRCTKLLVSSRRAWCSGDGLNMSDANDTSPLRAAAELSKRAETTRLAATLLAANMQLFAEIRIVQYEYVF